MNSVSSAIEPFTGDPELRKGKHLALGELPTVKS